MAWVYILQSNKNGSYYIGSTIDIKKRLSLHNKGLVKATNRLLPYRLMLKQYVPTTTEAKQVEFRMKRLKRRDYIEKMNRDRYIKTARTN